MKEKHQLHFIVSLFMMASLLLGSSVFAAELGGTRLPATVMPERVMENLTPQRQVNPRALPPLGAQKPQQAAPLGPQAEKIKFKLTKIILVGNKVYSEAELSKLYKNKVNTTITVAELQNTVQDITNYYRNNGYILTRAVLPPQHVANGVVKVQVIEGYINNVKVVGVPRGAKDIVQAYGERISHSRPTQIKVMEHYLLLANQLPGVQVKAVLEPSKTETGASDLNLVAESKIFSGYLSYDNYGTRYIGPLQTSAGGEFDSIFRSGDSTQFNFVQTTRPQELKFIQLLHNTPVGTNGMRWLVSGNRAKTQPGFVLAPLKINGDAVTVNTTLQYPAIRARTHNLTWDAGFNYIDSRVTALPTANPLYTDHLRTFRAGGNFDIADSWYGANTLAAHAEVGLPVLGATPESMAQSGYTSRFGGSGHFARADMQVSRLQQFGASRFSAFVIMTGQYAMEPLLSSEQFSFGGAQQGLGRGYDPAEIIGDRGMAGSAELRMNINPEKMLLQAAQFYVFYDAGVIWNLKYVIGQEKKQSAMSTGVGTRLYFMKNLSGNLMIAQPLTRDVQALEIIGNGRKPRVFFSVVASL